MKKVLIVSLVLILPVLVLAQGTTPLGNVQTLAQQVKTLINTLIPIVFALAMLFFFWGLALYIFAASDDAKREEGKKKMIWGIVALFVMTSVWGLVNWLGNAVGIQQEEARDVSDLIPQN